ncbi:unnamed protein product [Miscanthus lutarioriparius]|uniref:KIB1-4 beta-propeller domain-containing protein n=1 Tax=Miscanthus lutarioriparius TaxID=422564 RepID=A0A811RGY7_9POAL|nr:unnamed protein product [Miscanthus lutarioriparius]
MEEHADATKLGSSMSSCLPLLVFQHRHHGQEDVDNEMLMFSISKQSLHKNMEHGLLAVGNSSMCWTTPQGWILLARARDHDAAVSSACLWNPSTGDKLPLPDIITEEHEIPYHNRCMLSHKDPTHPGCVVVLFSYETPDFWHCHTAGDGGENNSISWRHHSYDIGNCASVPKPPKGKKARRSIRPIKRIISVMASFQGKIYFSQSSSKDNMCAIDFSSCTSTTNHNRPRFQKFNFPFVDLPKELSSGNKWLVESQDQLFAVTMGFIAFNPNNIGAIEVYRMDSSSSTQDRWRRVHDIGDVVFLLEDANTAASCSASILGLKANQIFFMKNIIDDDADLCIFDLETNTQEITQVHHHDDLILCRKPFWIVPPS